MQRINVDLEVIARASLTLPLCGPFLVANVIENLLMSEWVKVALRHEPLTCTLGADWILVSGFKPLRGFWMLCR